MKRIALLVLVVAVVLGCCGCKALGVLDRVWEAEEDVSRRQVDAFLAAVENRDAGALRELFAPNALAEVEDFDAMAAELFDYCSGDCVACDDWGACNSETAQKNGERQKTVYDTYDFQMESGDYRLALKYVAIDTAQPDNVGIWSVYIIRAEEDTDLQYAYRGDHNYAPGIWLGVKNVLPEVYGDLSAEPK